MDHKELLRLTKNLYEFVRTNCVELINCMNNYELPWNKNNCKELLTVCKRY